MQLPSAKWIAIRFEGGLGNQLFQYAAARALAMPRARLLFDTTAYTTDYLSRQFALDRYRVKGRIVSNGYLKKIITPDTTLSKFFSSVGLFRLIKEEGFRFHADLRDQLRIVTATKGYWQSEEYFRHIRPQLLEEIVPKYLPERPSFLNYPNTVAIHVRRADYLEDPRYGFIGENYYRNAIQRLRSDLMSPLFIWFSDDLGWCKEHFGDLDCLFADDNDWKADHLQLYLISQCDHQVIANSSFSWWGAWLNQNGQRVVIRPAKPFRDDSLLYEGHYPADWIAL